MSREKLNTKVLVGTLNLLGDANNPVEFLPLEGSLSSQTFMRSYQTLELAAKDLTFETVDKLVAAIRIAGKLPTEVEDMLARLLQHASDNGGKVWGFFDAKSLRNDNQILDQRLNLLTLATCSLANGPLSSFSTPEHQQQWHLSNDVSKVIAIMSKLAPAYSKDAGLFVWDLACSAVALECQVDYASVCKDSVLNPQNMRATCERLFSQMRATNSNAPSLPDHHQHKRIICFQEWPSEGSKRRVVFTEELARRGLSVLEGRDSVALAYDCDLSCRDLTDGACLSMSLSLHIWNMF